MKWNFCIYCQVLPRNLGDGDDQALGIRGFYVNQNPGIFETEIPGFFGIFCYYILDPLERSLVLRQQYFSPFQLYHQTIYWWKEDSKPSNYLLMERGQPDIKYKTNQYDIFSFSETNSQQDHP